MHLAPVVDLLCADPGTHRVLEAARDGDATVDVSADDGGATAVLKKNGETLTARIVSPAGAKFTVMAAKSQDQWYDTLAWLYGGTTQKEYVA